MACSYSCFFFSSRRRHTRSLRHWSSDVCSSDLVAPAAERPRPAVRTPARNRGLPFVHRDHIPAQPADLAAERELEEPQDRKSTRLNSSHVEISYAVFCLKKKKNHALRRIPQAHQ